MPMGGMQQYAAASFFVSAQCLLVCAASGAMLHERHVRAYTYLHTYNAQFQGIQVLSVQ